MFKEKRTKVRNFSQKKPLQKEMERDRKQDKYQRETCGICCGLMLLDYFGRLSYPTPKMKHRFYDTYGSKAFKGTTAAALADFLSWNELSVQLLHSSDAMMDNRDGYFPPALFQALKQEYLDRLSNCRDRVRVSTGDEIHCGTLKQLLDQGKQIALQILIPGNADGIHDHTLHWILVRGYTEDTFIISDPNSTSRTLSARELEHYMDTPIGRICLAVEEGLPPEEVAKRILRDRDKAHSPSQGVRFR